MKKRNNKEKCDNGIGPTCQNVTRMFGNRASHTNQYGSPALFYITISGNQSIGFFDSFCSRQSTSLFATVRQIRPHIHYHKGLSAFRMKSYPKLTTIVQFLFLFSFPKLNTWNITQCSVPSTRFRFFSLGDSLFSYFNCLLQTKLETVFLNLFFSH